VVESELLGLEAMNDRLDRSAAFGAALEKEKQRIAMDRWDAFFDRVYRHELPYLSEDMNDEGEKGWVAHPHVGSEGEWFASEAEAQARVDEMSEENEQQLHDEWLSENESDIEDEARTLVMADFSLLGQSFGAAEYHSEDWQLPGGRDYRELLLNLPVPRSLLSDDGLHESGHFGEGDRSRNLLGWARVNTRYSGGRKILFVEEIQSDWAQEGRENGFRNLAAMRKEQQDVYDLDTAVADAARRKDAAGRSLLATEHNLSRARPNLSARAEFVGYVLMVLAEEAGVDFAPAETGINSSKYPAGWSEHVSDARKILEMARQAPDGAVLNRGDVEMESTLGDAWNRGRWSPAQVEELLSLRLTDSYREQLQKWIDAKRDWHAAYDARDDLRSRRPSVGRGPIEGPFVTDTEAWVSLVLKKLLRVAADEGFDAIAWTTGEQQADRWSQALQQAVSEIAWSKPSAGRVRIEAQPTNQHAEPVVQELSESDLRANVGHEVAEQILRSPESSGTVSGSELHVGGLGFAGFYDRILPQVAQKLVKKLGGGAAWNSFDINLKGEQPGFSISPELRSRIQQPMPLFKAAGPADPRGRFFRTKDGRRVIELAGGRDRTTFAHELSHYYFDILEELVAQPVPNERALKDYAAVRDWQAKAWQEIQEQAAAHVERAARGLLGNVPPESLDALKERLASLDQFAVDRAIRMRTRDAKDPVDLAIRIAAEEYWARGWEKWLMQGSAPSRRLRTAFSRFARWMREAYGDASALEVSVSDEVAEMMRRLLASDDAIAQAEADMERAPLPMDGMTEGARTRYIELQLEARDYAEDRLRKEIMEDIEQVRSREYAKRWEETMERVTAEVHADPAYRAREALTHGRLPDGTPLPPESSVRRGINRAMAIALIGADDVQKVPSRALKRDGVNPQLIADGFGFDTGTQLLEALGATIRMTDRIEQLTKARMDELYPALLGTPQLSEEALSAIHNERQDAVLKWEAEWLMENAPQMVAKVSAAAGRARLLPGSEVTEQANAFLRARPVNAIRPDEYRRAEVQSHNEAIRLARTGDFTGAVAAKERERLSHALYREARDLRIQIPKMRREMAQAWKSDKKIAETRHLPFVLGMRAVLASVGMGKADQPPQYYLDKISSYAPEDAEDVRALVNSLSVPPGTDAESLSVADFFEVHRVAMALWRKALQVEQFTTNEGKVDLETVLRPAILELNTRSPMMGDAGRATSFGPLDSLRSLLLGAAALGRRTLSWVNSMDSNEFGGAFHVLFRDPIYAVTPKYHAALEASRAVLQQLAVEMGPLTNQAIPAKELTFERADGSIGAFTWRNQAHLIGGLIHAGNEGNLRKNLEGRGWSYAGWHAMLERMYAEGILEERHIRFVQGVWDLFESLKTPLWAAHYELRGYWPAEVKATPLVTPWGVFRGGYAPAVRDPDLDTTEDARMAERAFEDQHGFSFPAQVASGMTKERTDAVGPLWMDYRLIEKHISDVQKFIWLANPVREISRVLTNREFTAAMNRVNPKWIPNMLLPWIQRTGGQLVELPVSKGWRPLANVARVVRSRAALSLMVANMPNTLEQITGIAIAKTRIPAGYLRRAHMRYLQQPKQMTAAAFELSIFLRDNTSTRMADLQREFKNVLLDPTLLERNEQFFQKHGYIFQRLMQGYVNQVVWFAAFDYAQAEGRTEDASVQYADDQIRLTQGSFAPEDASALETGNAFARLFTTFVGYFNMLANLNATEFQVTIKQMGLRKGAGRLFYTYLYGFLIPMVTSRMIRNAFATAGTTAGLSLVGRDEDDDGWVDEFLETLFGAQFQGATAMVPFVGAAVQAVANKLDDERWNDQMRISPALSLIDESTAGAAAAIEGVAALFTDEELSRRQVRDMWALITLLGVPTAALRRAHGYLQDVEGGATVPGGPVDFTRGVLTGR
jgi:hypothetical protein